MQLGIIGMPTVGKTTIFELLTNSKEKAANQGKTNTAIARIPDKRIDYLCSIYKPKKTAYAQLELVDIPGLMPGSEKGSIMFLDAVRKADALLHVVRAFDNDVAPYIYDEIKPVRDIENIATELLIADMDLIEKRIERIHKSKKKTQQEKELQLLERFRDALNEEKPLSSVDLDQEEEAIMMTYQFLTTKPMLICVNVNEDDISSGSYTQKTEVEAYCKEQEIPVVEVCASIEREIAELENDEKEEFLSDLGITETGLVKITHSMYTRLELISFFTVGEDEVKAWTIEEGAIAKNAAGKIHSDIERGFIRAEVIDYNDFLEYKTTVALKEKGLFRLEGKEYVVKDGDIVHFRFNV
ncbi:MAG: redox-regulated ATPase YchF [Bacillota bacterium]|nr:redox-regulated ATPase YchF [Bacillota bacterium]